MASVLHFRGYYRVILRNVLPLVRHLKSGKFAKVASNAHTTARLTGFSPRFLSTETVRRNKLLQNGELGSEGNQRKLERALYRLDMEVRRTGRISMRDVRDIYNGIKFVGNPTSTQCLLLIRCCGSLLSEEMPETRSKLVDEIWKTLQEQGVKFDVSHYNAVLKVYLDNEHEFSPTDFLSDMESKGVGPNRVTYQRLIAHYCQKGDIAGASKILEFMKEKDLPINENVFNALIQGHSRANDMENAKSILEVMRTAMLDPGPSTYTQLLCGFAEKKDIGGIKATLNELEKNEIHLLDRDFLDVIIALAVNGAAEYVDELIPRMHKAVGYNQDVLNSILQLVNHGQEDVAYKLLLTMPRSTSPSGDPVPIGQFFIRHLVKVNRPKEKIMQFCNDLKQRGLNTVGVVRAAESSLVFGNADYALYFLEAMKAQEAPIRPHYFWPLFISHKNNNNERGVFDTVKLMSNMGAPANFDTLLEYVYPNLDSDTTTIVENLKSYGYSVGSVVGPLVTYLVSQKDLKNAVQLFKTFPVRLTPNSIVQPLAHAYHESKDLSSVLDVLLKINSNLEPNNKTDWTGQFLLEFTRLNSDFSALLPLLEGVKSKNLGISRDICDQFNRRFNQQLPENVSALLTELSSSNFEVSYADLEQSGIIPHPRDMNVNEMESHLIELKAKNMNTRGILRRLLMQHCRLRNVDRALQIKRELDEQNFVYSPAMYSQIMELHLFQDNLKEALQLRDLINEMDPDFVIDDHKVLNIATSLVKHDRLEDALKLIGDHHAQHGMRQKADALANNNWRLLNAAAEKGDADGVKRLFDLVYKCGYAEATNMVLGALVKVHLVRDDLNGALTEFEHCCKTYHNTPWKNELFLRLIKLEDPERLQKVVDLSTEIHGEMNTMYDLAFSFIEGDQFKQARKIFETPGFRARAGRLDAICERFLGDGKVGLIEQLVSVTRDVFDIDRDRMYFHLIRAYVKEGDAAKALGVWTTMQEEDVQPSQQTLVFLGKFLRKSGLQVPFALPADRVSQSQDPKPIDEISVSIRNGRVEEALNLKRSMEEDGRPLSISQSSSLISMLVQNERVNEAINVAKELFQKGESPHPSSLRDLIYKLAAAGDIDNITFIGNNLSEDIRRKIGFNNLKANGYVNGGRHLELLDMLEEGCPGNHADVPRSGLVALLKNHSNLLGRVEALARRYAETNDHAPLNMIWQHHFINGDHAKADEIYNSTPFFHQKLLFLDVIKAARAKNDESLLRKLTGLLKSSNVVARSKGIAYSAYIDLTCEKGDVDAALRSYEEGIELGLDNSDFNRSALLRLQRTLTTAGKPVPFNVAAAIDAQRDAASNPSSSSSSSSDSEDDRK